MRKIINARLSVIHTYIDVLNIVNGTSVELEKLSCKNLEKSAGAIVYQIVNIEINSSLQLCRYLTLRNPVDLQFCKEYHGEVKLNYLYFYSDVFDLITVAHCRFERGGDKLKSFYLISFCTGERGRYVHGSNAVADDPLIWFNSSSTPDANRHYLYADPRGSIIAAVNYTGASVGLNTYDEFGIPGLAELRADRPL